MPQRNSPETREQGQTLGDIGDIPTRVIVLSAGSILLVLVLLLPVMSWLVGAFGTEEHRGIGTSASTGAQDRTATPWENPAADLAAQQKQERERLETYRWIDRERGVVQIPIDRAMKLVAARNRNGSGEDAASSEGSSDE